MVQSKKKARKDAERQVRDAEDAKEKRLKRFEEHMLVKHYGYRTMYGREDPRTSGRASESEEDYCGY